MNPDAPGACADPAQFFGPLFDECRIHHLPVDWSFDANAIVDFIEAASKDPIDAANALFADFPYVTRLYTQISPNEMTVDPLFSFNPDLGNVGRVSTTRLRPICTGKSHDADQARVTWPNGVVEHFSVSDCGVPFIPTSAVPVGAVQVMNETGPAETLNPAEVLLRSPALELRVPTLGQSLMLQNVVAAYSQDTASGLFGLAGEPLTPSSPVGTDGADGRDGPAQPDGTDGTDGAVGGGDDAGGDEPADGGNAPSDGGEPGPVKPGGTGQADGTDPGTTAGTSCSFGRIGSSGAPIAAGLLLSVLGLWGLRRRVR